MACESGDSSRRRLTLASLPPGAEWLLVGVALAVLLRGLAQALLLFMRSPLNPDVAGFIEDARVMRAFYDCPAREPFHVLWLKAGLLFSSDAELVARLTTLVQTVLLGVLLYVFGARFFGRLTGLAALALFSINPVIRFYGVSGLRDPLFAAALLLFGILLFSPPAEKGRTRQALLAGAAGALLILTRVYAYAIVAGAFGVYLLHQRAWRPERRRPAARFLMWAALATAVLVVPDILFRPPSPIHGQTVNLFRNLELKGEAGSWQTDPPGSHLDYLFKDHTLPQVIARVTANYTRYAWQYLPFYLRGYEICWVLLPVGILAAFACRRGFVAGLLALALAPVVFVLNLNQAPGALGIESRFVLQAFPLALVLAVHGLLFSAERLLRLAASHLPAFNSLYARLGPVLLPLGTQTATGGLTPRPQPD